MFKLNLIKEKIERTRTNIIYSCNHSDDATKLWDKFIKNNIVPEYKKYAENDIFKRNMMLYLDALNFKDKALVCNEVEVKDFLEKLVHLSWKSDYHLMAYTCDKILNLNSNDYDWTPSDLENIFELNDLVSRSIYMFSRWVEKKVTYSLKFIIESDSFRLIDVNNLPLKGKNKSWVFKSIIKIIDDGAENNSSIIKALNFSQKIALLNSIDIPNSEKLVSFNLDVDYNKLVQSEAEKLFNNVANTLNQVRLFRNKVSHNEFILNRRNLTEFNMMLNNMEGHGFAFCEEPHLRVGNLRSEILESQNEILTNYDNDGKRDIIKSYLGIILDKI